MPKKTPPDENSERSAADYLPDKKDLKHLREASKTCKGCDLYKDATQTVFGEGNSKARVMLIGEQPGDVEDKEGHVFVGPAGKLLAKAMESAGLDRDDCYLTNAVKHFKYEWRGKRRLHGKPRRIEVLACMPWLEAEIAEVKPDVIVCLGATAAQALFGTKFRLTQHRGEFLESGLAHHVLATVHPSSILRAPDDETRHEEMERFIDDLKLIAKTIKSPRKKS
jgi:uracil-DNA glycosylase family protein